MCKKKIVYSKDMHNRCYIPIHIHNYALMFFNVHWNQSFIVIYCMDIKSSSKIKLGKKNPQTKNHDI